MKDIPYSELKLGKRAYDIMLLRDQYDNTFTDIAKDYGVSIERIKQIYDRTKRKQIHLYINHISVALEHENTSQIREVYNAAYECYQERSYACAYLEKKYKSILDEYRAGEPGTPPQFVRDLPPFKPKLTPETVDRVIEMREVEKASFIAIGKELHMTQAKARHTYESFYHKKVLELIKVLQEQAESNEEKRAISDNCFRGYKTSKKRYDELMKKMESL